MLKQVSGVVMWITIQ